MLADNARDRAGLWLVALPATFLFICFVVPNSYLLTTSVLKSQNQIVTGELTLENFQMLFGRRVYLQAIARTFVIGGLVGLAVVVLAYPTAYFLSRTTSRWRSVFMALALAPLLASVVVRTYGWWVVLNREGTVNSLLRVLGVSTTPIDFLPSSGAIVVGLTHALLPYGILTLLTVFNKINPQLERAAMSLGATRRKTFRFVILPLSLPGLAGAFLISFSLAISAYATPAILGGPATETMATLIYNLMMVLLDWSIGSALGVVLVSSAMGLMALGLLIGSRRETRA